MSGRKAYARAVIEKHPCQTNEPLIAFKAGDVEYPDYDNALVVLVHIVKAQVKGS
ncbi:hypothetical protein BHE74_00042239 [Ensete ventricosum]|nr:hypothetical protein BHE74_00042239 [Ensete ventricosum]